MLDRIFQLIVQYQRHLVQLSLLRFSVARSSVWYCGNFVAQPRLQIHNTLTSVRLIYYFLLYVSVNRVTKQKTAAATTDAGISCSHQPLYFSANSSVNCANCFLMKEQLHSGLLELEYARTIISLLRDDFNKANNASEATVIPKQYLPGESSGCEQAGDKWIPVVHCLNKKKKTPTVTSSKTDQPYISSNRFTPLTNLNESQADDSSPTSNCKRSLTTNYVKKNHYST